MSTTTRNDRLAEGTFVEIMVDGGGLPAHIKAHVKFDTAAERDAYIATLPKVLRVKATTLSGPWAREGGVIYIANFYVALNANDVNGGVNEAGIKRARRFLTSLVESGRTITYSNWCTDRQVTIDEFLAMA